MKSLVISQLKGEAQPRICWGVVPPAESQGAVKEEVAFELVKDGKEGS